jgi:hypothetical protein
MVMEGELEIDNQTTLQLNGIANLKITGSVIMQDGADIILNNSSSFVLD